MEVLKEVSDYMEEVGIKYVKNANDFIGGLAYRTDKNYAKSVADELNSRAEGSGSGQDFYIMKNKHSLAGSLYITSAFDGGVFRHIGNMIVEHKEIFGKEILDIGSDCGFVSCFVAKMYPNSNVTAIDKNDIARERSIELAKKLGLKNITFITSDVFEYGEEKKYDTILSFRTLLDVCEKQTKGLPFFGIIEERESLYKDAFSSYANKISNLLSIGGHFLSVERYTADYGWLGWLKALESVSLTFDKNSCEEMRASDISSVKAYSVTFAQKSDDGENSIAIYDEVMSKSFKSGVGCDGALAEFAFYLDMKEQLINAVVYKGEKPVHQLACAISNNKDKIMYYEAHGNTKRIKYLNFKKKDSVIKDIKDKLKLVSGEEYAIKHF